MSGPIPRAPRSQQLVASLLLILMAIGCFMLWTLVPAVILWALGELTDSATAHYFLGLVMVPVAIILFASLLARLNGLYLIVTGADRHPLADGEDIDIWRRRMRGPIEPLLFGSFFVALAALVIWILAFDHIPPPTVW
jgi:hypothetical protein